MKNSIFEKLDAINTVKDYFMNLSKDKQYWITECDSLEQRLRRVEILNHEFKVLIFIEMEGDCISLWQKVQVFGIAEQGDQRKIGRIS